MMKNVTQMVWAAMKVTNIRSEWNPDSFYGNTDSLLGTLIVFMGTQTISMEKRQSL